MMKIEEDLIKIMKLMKIDMENTLMILLMMNHEEKKLKSLMKYLKDTDLKDISQDMVKMKAREIAQAS